MTVVGDLGQKCMCVHVALALVQCLQVALDLPSSYGR